MDGLAHTAVSAAPPNLSVASIDEAVAEQFGLRGTYAPLVSERDQNFVLEITNGHRYVVKVTSSAETKVVSDFQIAALLHLEQFDNLRVPQVVRTLDGRSSASVQHDGMTYRLRLNTYLAGNLLASLPLNGELMRDFGAKLAALDIGLEPFSHEGEQPALLWDLQRAGELRALFCHVDDATVRGRVTSVIDDFERRVVPEISSLRTQVIHGDANPENVLIDPASHCVSGFIDFGDMIRAPLVFDVAIAAAYLRAKDTEPLEFIAPFVTGYCSVRPLESVELSLLFDLVRARLATTITLLYWRLCAREKNDPYRQKTLQREAGASAFLAALEHLGRTAFLDELSQTLHY